ncbi:MAG: UTP--glucose-1-phosphate uridylyltransferase [Dehalococcoidia bacterium]
MPVRKALVLAAGFGTRFLPVTKALPKELLPLVDRPVIHYVVEEAVAAGLEQIVLVTAAGKSAIEDYFDITPELERVLAARGDAAGLEAVRRPALMAEMVYVRQKERLGVGHAVLCARPLVGDEPFALFFPDDVILSRQPAIGQLIQAFQGRDGGVLAVERVPTSEISSYGVIQPQPLGHRLHRVLGLVEKPPPQEAPSDLAIVGRYVLTPQIFDALAETPPSTSGEIQLTDGLALLLRQQPLYAYEYEGERYDTGRPLGLLKASLAVALNRPDLASQLRSYLLRLDVG